MARSRISPRRSAASRSARWKRVRIASTSAARAATTAVTASTASGAPEPRRAVWKLLMTLDCGAFNLPRVQRYHEYSDHDRIAPVIVERVTRFLTSPQSDSFEDLALAAFAWQFERVEPYRRLCERRGVSPRTMTDWRQGPPRRSG